jgi:hypothetical protein
MRPIICLTAAIAAVCASSTAAPAKTAPPRGFEIKGSTWLLTDKAGNKIRESIDANGNYVANTVGGEHVDDGTAMMEGSKACFTSRMNKKGEVCWTTQPVKIGEVMRTTSDKGEKLKVTRAKYVPLEMRK